MAHCFNSLASHQHVHISGVLPEGVGWGVRGGVAGGWGVCGGVAGGWGICGEGFTDPISSTISLPFSGLANSIRISIFLILR